MIKKLFIEYCSPTLASLKVANLFRYSYNDINQLYNLIDEENSWLLEKGISIEVISYNEKSALLYMFRENQLNDILKNSKVQKFLSTYGYKYFNVQSCLNVLKDNFNKTSCPHEIGIFLGYPLEDVIGFIDNCGQNCECCGYWKVYHNKNEALRTFQKFKKCTDVYKKLFNQGTSIQRLTVAI